MKPVALLLILALLVGLTAGCAADSPDPDSTSEAIVWTPTGTRAPEETIPEPETLTAAQPEPTESEGPAYLLDDYEYALFPMEYLQITQTSGEGSHSCNKAVDLGGRNRDIDDFFAPFTCRIVRLQKGYNLVWCQSLEPVHLANGGLDYVTMLLEHDNNIDDLYVGQVIPQGQVFYQEGTAGNATGNHVHVEFGLGPYIDEGCFHAEDGRVSVNNGTFINEILFLTGSTLIVEEETGGFLWKYLPGTTDELIANGYACQGQGHLSLTEEIISQPTCVKPGVKRIVCDLCGESFSTTFGAEGHVLSETDRREPEGDVSGFIRYTCDVCGFSWQELLSSKPYDFGFTDVADRDLLYVAAITDRGIMSGFNGSDTEFLPEGFISRSELLGILYALGGQAGFSCDYMDVDETDEDYDRIAWATYHELAANTEGRRFSPDAAVSREDALKMVVGYLRMKGINVCKGDIRNPTDWAKDIGLLAAGDSARRPLTRGECARLLENMFLLLEQ